MSYFLFPGQLYSLADQLVPRIDAVLSVFGLTRVGSVVVETRERPDVFAEEITLRIPVRRREAV